jgi:hypothetical protein
LSRSGWGATPDVQLDLGLKASWVVISCYMISRLFGSGNHQNETIDWLSHSISWFQP